LLIRDEVMEELFKVYYDTGDELFMDLLEYFGNRKSDDSLKDMVNKIYTFSQSTPFPRQWISRVKEFYNLKNDDDFEKSIWKGEVEHNIQVLLEESLYEYKEAISIISSGSELDKISYFMDSGSLAELKERMGSFVFPKLKSAKDCDGKYFVKLARDNFKRTCSSINKLLLPLYGDFIQTTAGMYPYIEKLCKITGDFSDSYSTKKRERKLIDFNDIEHMAIQLLTVGEGNDVKPSDVALEYRKKYDEIMIDEYQDSNDVQELILSMVSRKDENMPNQFMVGDVKQSIYRFRLADPELFIKKYRTYSNVKPSKYYKIILSKNFRSRENIINSVNFIFSRLMSPDSSGIDYNEDEKLHIGASYPKSGNIMTFENSPVSVKIGYLHDSKSNLESQDDYSHEN
jgi:ATP-dependent helicase/nuclease subunit A